MTHTIDNVEIFATGTWNGDEYTEKDLDDIVEAFGNTKVALKPYVKLGHSQNQALLQKDGLPNAGMIESLKRHGGKLIAKLINVPKVVKELIDKGAYNRVSSEVFWNLKHEGKTYRRALKAVALLGADTPAVTSLNDVLSMYTENNNEFRTYEYSIKDNRKMDKIQELEHALEKKYSAEIEVREAEIAKLKAEMQADKERAYSEDVKEFVEAQVKEGKILPAQVEYFTKLLDGSEVKEYTLESGKKEMSRVDIAKEIFETMPKIVEFSEETHHAEVEKGTKDVDLDDKIKEYAKEHNVSYTEAFDAVAQGGE